MVFLTLSYIKQHSNYNYNIEDERLELYGNAAEGMLTQYLNRGKTAGEMAESLINEYGEIPSEIMQAGLILIDVSFQTREPIDIDSLYMIPYSFDKLLKPYIYSNAE